MHILVQFVITERAEVELSFGSYYCEGGVAELLIYSNNSYHSSENLPENCPRHI